MGQQRWSLIVRSYHTDECSKFIFLLHVRLVLVSYKMFQKIGVLTFLHLQLS